MNPSQQQSKLGHSQVSLGSLLHTLSIPMAPKAYDPSSENEQAPLLPSAPLVTVSSDLVIQPPLTGRGSGPGVILLLQDPSFLGASPLGRRRPLDPEPVQKWAEEGFSVAAVTLSPSSIFDQTSAISVLKRAIDGLLQVRELDTRDKFAVIVYDSDPAVLDALIGLEGLPIACLISYGASPRITYPKPRFATLLHVLQKTDVAENTTIYSYSVQSPHFVLPQTLGYDSGSASLAHSRSLVFLRKWLGGPLFDLEVIWDRHCYFEFEVRSVAKTMATMVQEPYVNHVPTMTGGVGRAALTEFYRDHFIFSNPDDTSTQVISRTVGPDRIIDEFIFRATHDRTIDWLLPGVPPTGRKLSIPMIAVVNIRGDRLYNEHIWWDQATALLQTGCLPTHVPYSAPDGTKEILRLPVTGIQSAHMLLDEANGKSNEMMGRDWGIITDNRESHDPTEFM